MKHWQFYVAILLLIFLILPIYESFEKLAPIQTGINKLESEDIPNIKDQIKNINILSVNSEVQAAESDKILKKIQYKYPRLETQTTILETQLGESETNMSDVVKGFTTLDVNLLPEINNNENISENSLTTFEYSLLPNIDNDTTLAENRTTNNENVSLINLENRASIIDQNITNLYKQNKFIKDVTDFFKSHDINAGIRNEQIKNGKYTIKQGMYCADEGDKFVCNRSLVGPWETHDIINLGGGNYNIKGGKNNKFCADEGNKFVCNRDEAREWENTEIINLGGGNYNIKGGKNKKYCHYDGTTFACNTDTPSSFQILPA
jgi:hypothetical protein